MSVAKKISRDKNGPQTNNNSRPTQKGKTAQQEADEDRREETTPNDEHPKNQAPVKHKVTNVPDNDALEENDQEPADPE